jgi:hypothetical protein
MLIKYICNGCGNYITKYFSKASDIAPFLNCGACSVGKLERQLGVPSTNSTQIVDNGAQARQVEVRNAVIEKEEQLVNKKEEE